MGMEREKDRWGDKKRDTGKRPGERKKRKKKKKWETSKMKVVERKHEEEVEEKNKVKKEKILNKRGRKGKEYSSRK